MLRRFAAGDEQTIAGLRAYWDAVVSGRLMTAEQCGLEPDLAATVQHILQRDDALSASPEFAAKLLEQLTGKPAAVQAASPAAIRQLAARSGPVVIFPTKPSRIRAGASRAWAVISAGSVLLIVLAIAAGFFIWNANEKPAPAIIPLHSETTANGVLIQTILEEHVDPGMLPGNPTKWIASFKFSLEPGEAWRDRPISCELARQYVVGLVESGTLAMINAGPFEVTRSDGTKESIQAGERANLQAGDSWVYLSDRTETNVQKWNPGSVPMVAFQTDWALDSSCETIPGNPEWHWHESVYGATFDPSRPVVVTFEQAIVQPGTMLSGEDAARIGFAADESVVFSVIGIESGTLDEAIVPEPLLESTLNRQEPAGQRTLGPGDAWSSELLMRPMDAGLEREFHAGDDEPLVLSVISWSYGDIQSMIGDTVDAADREIERTVLIDHHVAADTVSRVRDSLFVMNRTVVPPGGSVAYPSSCGAPTLMATAVESGVYSIQADSQLDVTRANGTAETIEPGTSVELGAGDSVIYANVTGDSLSTFRNAGSEPLALVQAIWFPEAGCTFGQDGSEDRSQIAWMAYDRLPALKAPAPFTLTIQHVTAPNFQRLDDEDILGLAVPRYPADNLARMAVESGTLQEQILMIEGSERTEEFRATHESGAILTLDDSLTFGTQYVRQLAGSGVEPLELTIVSIIYEPGSG